MHSCYFRNSNKNYYHGLVSGLHPTESVPTGSRTPVVCVEANVLATTKPVNILINREIIEKSYLKNLKTGKFCSNTGN